jgi:acyl-CoA thioesterase
MDDIKRFFDKGDRFAAHNGIEVTDVAEGWAKARLTIRDEHLNGLGTLHGGAIFTLADLALAAAANSHGTAAVLINGSASFLKAARSGVVQAEAREVSRGSRIASYAVTVTDEAGQVVAVLQGMVYRMGTPIPGNE